MADLPRAFSPSRLQTYSDCGLAYYLSKIERVPQREAHWFGHGTSVHDTIEAYERSLRTLTPAEAEEIFHAAYDREAAEALERQPNENMWMVGGRMKRATDQAKRRELGLTHALDYMRLHPADDAIRPAELVPGEPAIEVGFELDFEGVRVIGYIDCIMEERSTGRLMPEDWKTGKKVPGDRYQLGTYKHAIEQLTGQPVDWGRFWMCRENDYHQVDLRPVSFELVSSWYRQLATAVAGDVFLANPKDCFACTVKPSCPEYN